MYPRSLAQVTQLAELHFQNRDCEQAVALLGPHLIARDPSTASPEDRLLVEAAYLFCLASYTGTLSVPWTRFVYQALRRHRGDQDPDTLTAMNLFAAALGAAGDRDAVDIRRDRLALLAAIPAERCMQIFARRDLALALHQAGSCTEAIREGHRAWAEVHPVALEVFVAPVGVALEFMLQACGRFTEAGSVNAQLRAEVRSGYLLGVRRELHRHKPDLVVAHHGHCACQTPN